MAGIPEPHRPPVYPVYLAINYAVFGKDNLLAPVIVQHVLFFIASIIVGYLAYQLAGLVAAVVSYGFIFTDFTSVEIIRMMINTPPFIQTFFMYVFRITSAFTWIY